MTMNEVAGSIVIGIVAVLILEMLRSGDGRDPAISSTEFFGDGGRRRRADGFLVQFTRLIVSVAGGVALSMLAGQYAIEKGYLPEGLATRLSLLLGGTVMVWVWLVLARGKR